MAALAWGSLIGPYLNLGYCWDGDLFGILLKLLPNQQERIKLVDTRFKLTPVSKRYYSTGGISEYHKYWLGGFVEGEGSLLVSITTNPKVKYGIVLQPEFNVTQHESGLNVLKVYKTLFNGLGNLKEKSGSNKVWVYSLKGTKNVKELVLPFYTDYVVPFSSKHKSDVFERFKYIVDILYDNLGQGLNKEQLIEVVNLIYELNPDSKGKSRKRDIQEVLDIINSSQ